MVPSEKVPVALNCWVVPFAILGFVGVTVIDDSVAGVTVNVVFLETVPTVAVIAVVPTSTDVARPALLIVATSGLDELQVTCVVRFCVVLSEKVPVAVNCCVVPLAMLGFAGVTAMDTSVAGVTVNVVFPEIPP